MQKQRQQQLHFEFPVPNPSLLFHTFFFLWAWFFQAYNSTQVMYDLLRPQKKVRKTQFSRRPLFFSVSTTVALQNGNKLFLWRKYRALCVFAMFLRRAPTNTPKSFAPCVHRRLIEGRKICVLKSDEDKTRYANYSLFKNSDPNSQLFKRGIHKKAFWASLFCLLGYFIHRA